MHDHPHLSSKIMFKTKKLEPGFHPPKKNHKDGDGVPYIHHFSQGFAPGAPAKVKWIAVIPMETRVTCKTDPPTVHKAWI